MEKNLSISPLGDYILVREIEEKVGIMLLPENAKGKLQKAEVLAVSEDIEQEISVGDKVVYSVNKGHEIDGYKLVLASDLLAKI